MSLDGFRDALLREKTNEITTSLSTRKRKLRELYRVTTACTAALNAGSQPKLEDAIYSDPDEKEGRFLDENDQAKGRRFNDSTLPFPTLDLNQHPQRSTTLPVKKPINKSSVTKSSPSPAHVVASFEDQLRAASASPSVATQTPPSLAIQNEATNSVFASKSPLSTSSHAVEENSANKIPTEPTSEVPAVQGARPETNAASNSPPTGSDAVVPGVIEDVNAVVSADGSVPATTNGTKRKEPQTVHLPSKEVQEARLQETERKLERAAEKERREEERLSIPQTNGPVDASSPSSTVGPYSQATPHAPHHSPDTSPDTESFHDRHNVPMSNEESDPAAQQVKEDHERALQKKMRVVRDRTREDESPTPDIEKQIENEEAIRLARDGKPRSNHAQHISRLQAIQPVANKAPQEILSQPCDNNIHDPAADSLPTPTTTAPEPSTGDRDTIDHPSTRSNGTNPALDHPTPPSENDADMADAPTTSDQTSTSQPVTAQVGRTTSRVPIGAIRQKSLSDAKADKATSRASLTTHFSDLSAPASPPRPKTSHHKSQEISTVVFAKKTPTRSSKALQSYNEDYASLQGASEDSSRDYLEALFRYQAHHPPRSAPLQDLVASARKTVSTAGTLAMIREHQDYKILKRVYQLQNANRWSLRQLQKAVEPERPFTHQDQLLLEMKWMRTDFKEERKWKQSLASTFAEWCAEYVNSRPAERDALRVKSFVPKSAKRASNDDEDMNDAPTPDLVHSGANETESESYADEDELLTPFNANAPADLFSMGWNDVVMTIVRTPASDTMFRELPFYEPMLEGASDSSPFSLSEPPILPVSKFVTGKLVSQIQGPPKKRSRYDYDSEDEPSTPPSRSGTSAEHSMPSTPGRRLFCRNDLPPEMIDVALFNAENKHVRDRLQAAHQFRPPTEFNMPSVAFFENRTPSQWLWEEDQKLRALVKEYTFNWSLVSQQLSLPSLFVSGSGRRTPWECFERWVQLEGLPAEMSKTQYFRTYQSRLEQANKTVYAQFQAQQQQQGQAPSQPRRRPTTTPIRVERRRENRHLAIIDGMRKLARKRESTAHKQAESQKAAALRKAHEPAAPKSNVHTPQEFSRLKWEREEKLKQRQLQQEMMVRQQMAAQRQAQMQGQPGMANGINQMQRNGTPGVNANVSTQIANPAQPGQNGSAMAPRPHQGQQGMPSNFANGNMSAMPMGTPGVPQAQMQANMQGAQRMGPPDQMRMAMQRGQFNQNQLNANQQHQFQLQQQQINMASNLTQGMGMNGMPNANMMAPMPNQGLNGALNGNMNTALNGMPTNAGSPRMSQANPNVQNPARPLSSGHMPQLLQIQNSLKVQHPEWTPEQVQKVASEQLSRFLAKQRAQAMNAAAGSSGMSPSAQIGNNHYMQQQNGGMSNSPQPNAVQNYQQQLVQQQRLMSQQQRQQAGSPNMNARPPSRSATPQNAQMQHSPGMQQAQINRS